MRASALRGRGGYQWWACLESNQAPMDYESAVLTRHELEAPGVRVCKSIVPWRREAESFSPENNVIETGTPCGRSSSMHAPKKREPNPRLPFDCFARPHRRAKAFPPLVFADPEDRAGARDHWKRSVACTLVRGLRTALARVAHNTPIRDPCAAVRAEPYLQRTVPAARTARSRECLVIGVGLGETRDVQRNLPVLRINEVDQLELV